MTEFHAFDRGNYWESDLPQRTDEWLLLRQGKITGSNFGTAVDLNPHKSARQYQRDLAAQRPFKGNRHTNHGTFWEPRAIKEYTALTGNTVREMGFAIPKKTPWIGVSPDGIISNSVVEDFALLEVKCPSTKDSYGGIPDYYMAQVQGLMGVLGLPLCHFVVFRPALYGLRSERDFAMPDDRPGVVPTSPGRIEVWEVQAHAKYQTLLRQGLAYFWSKVIAGHELCVPSKGKNPVYFKLLQCEVGVNLKHEVELHG
jgi:putative phage-type endonuclease